MTFFLDTYALVEILKGSNNYNEVAQKPCVMTKLNLLELHHVILREHNSKKADEVFEQLLNNCVSVEYVDFLTASKMRFNLKKQNVSFIDCVGYVIAQRMKVPFVTGDKEFENVENVLFIK